MRELYLIRHGQANYGFGLNSRGRRQVQDLRDILATRLPIGETYAFLFSPAFRTRDTGRIIYPLVNEKSSRIYRRPIEWMGQEVSMLPDEELREKGKLNVGRLLSIDSAITLVVSHKEIIGATALAFAEQQGISLDEGYDLWDHREGYVIPSLREANAIYFNLDNRISEFVRR